MRTADDIDFGQLRPPEAGPELIIGLVGATAAGQDTVAYYLENALEEYDYRVETDDFRLSDRIKELPELLDDTELVEEPEDERIRTLQQGGNEIRRRLNRNDALALLTCLNIREYRNEHNGSHMKQVPRQAYILNSLKTPAEVKTLREIYGDGFFLISVFAPKKERHERLAERIANDKHGIEHYTVGENEQVDSEAEEIIEIDRHQPGMNHGQNVRDTFPKGDFFVDATNLEELKEPVTRCVELIFGAPFETPTRDEQCMYVAEGARLRSSALGRQVGASLAKPEGEVVSIGCNDAPRAGGGLYWPDHESDHRDFQLATNITQEKRLETLQEVLVNLEDMGALEASKLQAGIDDLSNAEPSDFVELMDELDDTRVSSLIEFYRATHAEMEAILSASRKGIPVEGTTLYSTTFPCHECTRHIIAAGVNRVLYVEPYPKSLGPELHGDAVNVDGRSPARELWKMESSSADLKVDFEPFVGAGPRIYEKVFGNKERVVEGKIVDWPVHSPDPIFGLYDSGWAIDETIELTDFEKQLEDAIDD